MNDPKSCAAAKAKAEEALERIDAIRSELDMACEALRIVVAEGGSAGSCVALGHAEAYLDVASTVAASVHTSIHAAHLAVDICNRSERVKAGAPISRQK